MKPETRKEPLGDNGTVSPEVRTHLGFVAQMVILFRWLPTKGVDLWNTIIFYLRFTGYWAAVTLLLLLSQVRSTCWSKSILRRLEII